MLTNAEPNGQMMERRPVVKDGCYLQVHSDDHDCEQYTSNLYKQSQITPGRSLSLVRASQGTDTNNNPQSGCCMHAIIESRK